MNPVIFENSVIIHYAAQPPPPYGMEGPHKCQHSGAFCRGQADPPRPPTVVWWACSRQLIQLFSLSPAVWWVVPLLPKTVSIIFSLQAVRPPPSACGVGGYPPSFSVMTPPPQWHRAGIRSQGLPCYDDRDMETHHPCDCSDF